MHPLVVAPLLEVPSAEDTATDGSMARHFDPPPPGTGHCGKRGLFWAILPVTPRGNTYIFLFTDRFSRRADMFVVTTAEFTAEGTANILINRYIPLWGCPRNILSDNGLQFCSKLSHVVYELLGVRKIATSSYHASGDGGVERVNSTVPQMLAMVVNGRQDVWDAQLPHVEFAYNNSVSATTGLAPNEVHMDGQTPAPPSHYFRPLRGCRPSEPGPRPPRILRPGVRMPTARKRYCSRDACLNNFPCGTEKQSPFGRFAPGPQLRCE